MNSEFNNIINKAANNKLKLLKSGFGKYILSSILGGAFIGIALILTLAINAEYAGTEFHSVKIINSIAFSAGLTLIIFFGGELFTGNNAIMSTSFFNGQLTFTSVAKIWVMSFLGNYIGAILLSLIYYLTDLYKLGTGEVIIATAQFKINQTFIQLFAKGFLCNILVCLAVVTSLKISESSGKYIIILACLFPFIYLGFEHSVANMTLFSLSLIMDHPIDISVLSIFRNLVPVTLGNLTAGITLGFIISRFNNQ